MNDLRSGLILTLLALVLTHALALTAIRAEFVVNQATIERTLCVNRDRPELQCHGRCALRRSIMQAEEASSGPLQLKPGQLADLFLAPPALELEAGPSWALLQPRSAWPRSAVGSYDRYRTDVFHPPAVADFWFC